MHRKCFTILGAIGLSAALAASALAGPGIGDAVQDFQEQNPRSGIWFTPDGRITKLYGKAFSHGPTAEESAQAFLIQHLDVFGDQISDLVAAPLHDDPGILEGLMYNRDTDAFKFWLINYEQQVQGIPVFEGGLRLLIRNEPTFPLVMASANIRDLTGLNLNLNPGGVKANQPNQRMLRKARRQMGGDGEQVAGGDLVIWAGIEGMVVEPRLAVQFILETDFNQPDYQKVLFLSDTETGAILYQEDLVLYADIEGNVSGMATEGIRADICLDGESPRGLPWADVRVVGGNVAFTDVNGDFVIPHGGNQEVTVQSFIRGRWFEVFDRARGNQTPLLTMQVTPPGPADFLHNAANNNEFDRANVNAYIHANVIRDMVLFFEPDYPVIANQPRFDIFTNVSANCNAFYNGTSINFFTSGGGCSNTANSTVVYHEYGHHLVAMAQSGQGQYGEGMGDTVGVVITDDPNLALGFFADDCDRPLRTADNDCQYDPNNCTSNCGRAIHSCGRLLSGSVWSTRNELIQTEPAEYLNIIRALTFGSIRVRPSGDRTITPQITIDFLELDDDDDDIGNGTPHYQEIATGFGAHNMDAPPLQLIGFEYPNGRPEFVRPSGGTTMMVNVLPLTQDPQPGTGILHVNRGAGFEEFPMQEIADNVYEAVFPSSQCGDEIRFFVSAETVDGDMATSPPNAPSVSFRALSGSDGGTVFEDDFNTNQGWTVVNINLATGAWQRGVPVNGGRGDPPADHDGSGFAYVTDNRRGDFDVDGGPTILTSPQFDLSDGREYIISYARWFSNSSNGQRDFLDVEVSRDNGTTWTRVERVLDGGSANSWVERSFLVSDFVNLSRRIRVRFVTQDQPNDSVVEAGVDAFTVTALECDNLATLTDLTILDGFIVAGGLPELEQSDDQVVEVEARVTGEASQPHLIRARIGAQTETQNPATINLTIESKITDVEATVWLFLRDWNTGDLVQVDQFTVGMQESVRQVSVPDAGRFVRSGDGRIELEIKEVVFVPFTLNGFHALFDQVSFDVQ